MLIEANDEEQCQQLTSEASIIEGKRERGYRVEEKKLIGSWPASSEGERLLCILFLAWTQVQSQEFFAHDKIDSTGNKL